MIRPVLTHSGFGTTERHYIHAQTNDAGRDYQSLIKRLKKRTITTRVAIDARLSSQMQSKASIGDQLRICRERATREGWNLAEVFSDMAVSGASMQPPGVHRLMEETSKGSLSL